MPNCRTIPFDRLLAEGVKVPRNGDLRPAGSVSSALQLIAVIFQLQSLEQFGGVSAGHIDWTLVPYVRKSFHKNMKMVKRIRGEEWECPERPETVGIGLYFAEGDPAAKMALEMTENELAQAVEAFYHNLNTLQSRSGNQLPFTSINYGTCTEPEGRMVTRALLEGSLAGIGSKHLTPIFPCGVFQMKEGVNRREGDPNYDLFRLALKSTAERVYPNYANCDWSGNYGYEEGCPETYFSTMGCRTANGYDINGLGQLKDGRGNVCPVTIILPELAMRVGGDPVAFMEELPGAIDLAADMLVERYRHICAQPVSAAPFTFQNKTIAGYVEGEGAESGHRHGTLSIGQLGLAEALRILVGEDHTAPRGMEMAHRIESVFRDRCAALKKERSLNFGVYYTPAENLCHTALKQFRRKWGEIPGVSDKEFFTNSMHVPVWHEMDAFRKIDIESELTGYSSAGCITYVELDAACRDNLDAIETLVGYAMDKDIPYFAINTPHDMCGGCGKTGEFGETCPECGSSDIRRLRRVTGYLTADYKTSFNAGKRQEVELRRRHS
jgi:ribonucleoside-triphosphate reductase